MLKNVDFDCDAIHFPIKVFPVPGGPNKRIPRGGFLNPLNRSGLRIGHTTASLMIDFAYSKPAISSQAKEINELDVKFDS